MPPWHIIRFHRFYHRFDSRTVYIGLITGCIDTRVTCVSWQRGHGDLFDHFGHIISPYTGIHIHLSEYTDGWFVIFTDILIYMFFIYEDVCLAYYWS